MGNADSLDLYDDDHSLVEDRYISIGPIARGVVVVVWTSPSEDCLRILSARWATSRERSLFVRHLQEYR